MDATNLADGQPAFGERGGQLPAISQLCRSLCLLALVGMSLGLTAWALRVGDKIVPYVHANLLTPADRRFVLADVLGGALFSVVLASVVLATRSRSGIETLRRLSVRLSPLLLAWTLPPLFDWHLWGGHDLTFLCLVGLTGLGLQRLVRAALVTPAAFPGLRAPGFLVRPAAALLRAFDRPALPLVLVTLAGLGYGALFSFYTLRNHYRLGTASLDLGLESNLVWNAAHLGPLFKSSPLGGPNISHGGFHQTYFAYLLALPFRIWPGPRTLLVIQALFAGLAAVPLYFLGQRYVPRASACVVALLYLLYAPLHGANLYDFHYLLLAPLLLWTTVNLVEAGHYKTACLTVLLSLSVREDVAALLSIFGLYLVLSGRRPVAGLLMGLAGGLYFVTLKMFVMPRFLSGSEAFVDMFKDLLPEGERGYGGVLKTLFGNPGYTLGTLLERDKLIYVLQIMTPVAFLPWRRPIGVLLVIPGFLFTLLSTRYPPLIQPTFQYTTYWTAFVFLGVLANLGWLWDGERHEPGRAAELRANRHAWLFSIVTTMLVTSHQYGAVLQHHTARGGFGPYRFDLTPLDVKHHEDFYHLIAKVPPMAKIVSSETLVPHVCDRPNSYTLRMGLYDADYLITWTPPRGEERKYVVDAIKSGTFGVVEERGEFLLAKRGYSTALNAATARKYGF